jgi:hypothetical protein
MVSFSNFLKEQDIKSVEHENYGQEFWCGL